MMGRNAMFKSIKVEGLRGFSKKIELRPAIPSGEPGSGITIITGPNNSGKSTIIEAFKAIGSTDNRTSFNVGMRNANCDFVTIIAETMSETYTLSSVRAGGSECMVDKICPEVPHIVPSRRHFNNFFGKTSITSREEFARDRLNYAVTREQVMSRFESRLFAIEKDRARFDDCMKRVVPEFDDWAIDLAENESYFIRMKSSLGTHSAHGAGDGILSVFVIVAALFDSPIGDTIIIDEPELSLHPRLQKNLFELLIDLSKDRQIIIATHSPYFISRSAISNGAVIAKLWRRDKFIELYSISVEISDDLKVLSKFNPKNPHVFGLDAREIFFEGDPVIVLEGQDDVVFLSEIDLHGKIKAMSVYGWGSGGGGNIQKVCAVLKSLGHKKIIAVFDNNIPTDVEACRNKFPDILAIELPAPDIRTKSAEKAREEVRGLCDSKGKLRQEYRLEIEKILHTIDAYLVA